MQRRWLWCLSFLGFAGTAHAQPVPDAGAPPSPAAPVAPGAPAGEPAPVASSSQVGGAPPSGQDPALPRKVAVGKDSKAAFVTPGLLLQGWFVQDFGSSLPDAAGDTTTVTTLSTFRVRRAELSVGGELIPKFLKYKLMFDPARVRDTLVTRTAVDAAGNPVTVSTPASPLSTLQDVYITFQSELADVSIGQFKIPVSWEGIQSASKLLLPERPFVSGLLGDKRDLGIRVEKTFAKFGYMAGVFNGAGLDNFDNNDQKDLSLRLEAYPIKGMTVAGVVYDAVGYRKRAGTKDRWEVDFRYETGPYLVQAEYIRARDVKADGATACTNAAGACTAHGAYAAFAYKIANLGTGNWRGDLQPVVRVGFYDNDVDNDVTEMAPAEIERIDYEVGANYYLRNHELKLQVSYDRQQFANPDTVTTRPAVNEIILAAQVWF